MECAYHLILERAERHRDWLNDYRTQNWKYFAQYLKHLKHFLTAS